MKFNKKLMAGAMASLMVVSSFAMAAPEKKNLVATYGVSINVNGSAFAVKDNSMRPFITQDGRTYMSVAALNQMGIASVGYDKASKTVSVNSSGGGSATGNVAQLQAQVSAQTAEISRLQYENNQLKAELDKLKSSSSSSSSSNNKQTGTKELSDMDRSTRRDFEKELKSEIKALRADTTFDRSQRFDGDVSIGSKSITLSLTPRSGDFSSEDKTNWNKIYDDKRSRDRAEEDYAEFVEDDVMDMIKGILKDYKGYNIEVVIYSDTAMKTKIVDADYNYNRDRSSATIYKL